MLVVPCEFRDAESKVDSQITDWIYTVHVTFHNKNMHL